MAAYGDRGGSGVWVVEVVGWPSCGGSLGDAPLAAGAFDDVGGGVALAAGVVVTVTVALRGLEVA